MKFISRKESVVQFGIGIMGFIVLAIGLVGCCAHQVSSDRVVGQSKHSSSHINSYNMPPNKIVTFTVVGKGVEPEISVNKGQAFILAERAALMDGYRLLIEKLKGVYVEALSQAGLNAIDYDQIHTKTQALLRGVKITDIVHKEYGIAQVTMQVRVNFTRYNLLWWPEGLGGVSPTGLLSMQ